MVKGPSITQLPIFLCLLYAFLLYVFVPLVFSFVLLPARELEAFWAMVPKILEMPFSLFLESISVLIVWMDLWSQIPPVPVWHGTSLYQHSFLLIVLQSMKITMGSDMLSGHGVLHPKLFLKWRALIRGLPLSGCAYIYSSSLYIVKRFLKCSLYI